MLDRDFLPVFQVQLQFGVNISSVALDNVTTTRSKFRSNESNNEINISKRKTLCVGGCILLSFCNKLDILTRCRVVSFASKVSVSGMCLLLFLLAFLVSKCFENETKTSRDFVLVVVHTQKTAPLYGVDDATVYSSHRVFPSISYI